MTWDEIYEAADGKACGEWKIKRKDTARYYYCDNMGWKLIWSELIGKEG